MRNLLKDFFGLFYPQVCAGCGERLLYQEKVICTSCLGNIPRTNFHDLEDNPVNRLFWGRIKIESATAFFRFHKGSRFQELLHQLKYKGRMDIGIELGRQLGFELGSSGAFKPVEVIVPVPLHPKREKKRGYNQSECIARGIALSMNIEIQAKNLVRTVATKTQTKKTRIERWENVESIFRLTEPEKLEGKNILLVDDVITTGATLESSAQALLEASGCKVYVAALAMA